MRKIAPGHGDSLYYRYCHSPSRPIAARVHMAIASGRSRLPGTCAPSSDFPFRCTRDHPYWVPPLLFDERNTLRQEEESGVRSLHRHVLAGRAGRQWSSDGSQASSTVRTTRSGTKRSARFGWFDFIDDDEVPATLLATVEAWARKQGMTEVAGPARLLGHGP